MSIPGIPVPTGRPQPARSTSATSQARIDRGIWLVRIAALVALGIAGYLTYAALAQGGHVAGCDDSADGGCGQVLRSRWASWLGMPVSLPAMLVYLTTLASTGLIQAPAGSSKRNLGWALLAMTAVLTGGAAIWFVGLQLLSLGNLCWYCLTLHACGIVVAGVVAWRLPHEMISQGTLLPKAMAGAAAGVVGIAALISGQVLVSPEKPEMQVVKTPSEASEPVDTNPPEVAVPTVKSTRIPQHPWSHRRMSLMSGLASLDLYDYPYLGDRDAERPLLEVFDYTCPHCRELSVMLEKVHKEFGSELALVMIPMPMNSKCNPFVKVDHARHATACELARLAIAVWHAKPDAFVEFHQWMMQGETPPTPQAAKAEAVRRVGADELKKALADPAVDAQLLENGRLYSLMRDHTKDGSIPKLAYERAVSSGLPSSEDRLRTFLKNDVGLRPAP